MQKPKLFLIVLPIIEGLIAGVLLAAMPYYIPLSFAFVAFAAYCFLRASWSSLFSYLIFWLSSWLSALVFSMSYEKVTGIYPLVSLGLDSGLLVAISVVGMYVIPYLQEHLGFLRWPLKIIVTVAFGLLLALGVKWIGGPTVNILLFAISGGIVVHLVGRSTKLLGYTTIFMITYIVTLFLAMNGLSFMNYNAYECVLISASLYGPVAIASFLPLLAVYASQNLERPLHKHRAKERPALRCPGCGAMAAPEDSFCGSCGNSLGT